MTPRQFDGAEPYEQDPEFLAIMREVIAGHVNAQCYIPVGVQSVMCGHCGEHVAMWWHVAMIPHKACCMLLRARRVLAGDR